MAAQTCNDPNPHGPHTWYSPKPGTTQQEQHECPGVS